MQVPGPAHWRHGHGGPAGTGVSVLGVRCGEEEHRLPPLRLPPTPRLTRSYILFSLFPDPTYAEIFTVLPVITASEVAVQLQKARAGHFQFANGPRNAGSPTPRSQGEARGPAGSSRSLPASLRSHSALRGAPTADGAAAVPSEMPL